MTKVYSEGSIFRSSSNFYEANAVIDLKFVSELKVYYLSTHENMAVLLLLQLKVVGIANWRLATLFLAAKSQ